MKIIFGYYDDEDFGLMEYPEIVFPHKEEFEDEKDFEKFVKKAENITKYLITGIMEDFQYSESCEMFLKDIKKVESGEKREVMWDGQAFQHKLNKNKVTFNHTIFDDSEEYPEWSCKFKEYKKVLIGWEKFLRMKKSLKSKVEIEI